MTPRERQDAADDLAIEAAVVQGRIVRWLGFGLTAWAAYAFGRYGIAAWLLVAALWFLWRLSRPGELDAALFHRANHLAAQHGPRPPLPFPSSPRQARKVRGAK